MPERIYDQSNRIEIRTFRVENNVQIVANANNWTKKNKSILLTFTGRLLLIDWHSTN